MDALWVSAKRKTKYELKNNYNGLKGLEKERKRKELLNEHYSLSVLLYFEENTQYGVKVTKIKYDDII